MSAADRAKWDAKYAGEEPALKEPSAVLVGLRAWLPRTGRALDVAGGAGRNGIWLARRGLDVMVADVSAVGLGIARQRAEEAGVKIVTLRVDLEEETLDAGPFDLVVSLCYLWRPRLISQIPKLLAAGGTLVIIQPTNRNLERNEKPPADYLVREGALREFAKGLEIVHYEEGWLADGRHDAVVVARKMITDH